MRTLILSDLHLGDGGARDAFAGRDALPAMLDQVTAQPTRVVLNGDTLDLLGAGKDGPISPAVARRAAEAVVAAPGSAAVLQALGRVLARGGELIVLDGNHDPELAFPEVRDVLTAALGQPPKVALRAAFRWEGRPELLDVGGVSVLVDHGHRDDAYNRIDHARLLRGVRTGDLSEFRYPPGSMIARRMLGPLVDDLRMRFLPLLAPDFRGALLAALALEPGQVKAMLEEHGLSLGWQLFRNAGDGPLFFGAGDEEEDEDLGLADVVDQVELDEEERAELEELFGDDPMFFAAGDEDSPSRRRGLLKLGKAGLKAAASRLRGREPEPRGQAQAGRGLSRAAAVEVLERSVLERSGVSQALAPDPAELAAARDLARSHGARVVVSGHTHAARFADDGSVVLVNSGTWASLLDLPEPGASGGAWETLLQTLRGDPALAGEGAQRLRSRFTAALAEPGEDGATLSLVEWSRQGRVETLGEARLAR